MEQESGSNPSRFYWAGYFGGHEDYANMAGLASGVVDGVAGISSSSSIVRQWLPHRQFLMIMDSDAVLASNPSIIKVDYEDLDGMVRNNFMILRRLFNEVRFGDPYRFSSLWSKLTDYIAQAIMKLGGREYAEVAGKLRWDGMRGVAGLYEEKKPSFQTADEFARFIYEVYPLKETELSDFTRVIRAGLFLMGRTYRNEQEWILPERELVVPEGSRLIINGEKEPEGDRDDFGTSYEWGRFDKYSRLLDAVMASGLDKRYRISIADHGKVDRLSAMLFKNKRDEPYDLLEV